MTHKEFLTAFLGKTLNIPADKVASLLKDDGTGVNPETLDFLLNADVSRVNAFKAESQTMFDNGQKKATKEIMSAFESKIKSKYGLTTEKIGEELIDEIVKSKTSANGEVDENKVKSHPAYIALQDESTKKIKDAEKQWKEKYDNREKEILKKETFQSIFKIADSALEKFALPQDKKLAENQKKLLYNDLQQYDFKDNGKDANGNTDYIPLYASGEKAGQVVNDEHGNRISPLALIERSASQYWLKSEGKERSGAGGNNDGGTGGSGGSGGDNKNPWLGKITTDEQYSNALSKSKTGAERIQIKDAYDAHRKASSGDN